MPRTISKFSEFLFCCYFTRLKAQLAKHGNSENIHHTVLETVDSKYLLKVQSCKLEVFSTLSRSFLAEIINFSWEKVLWLKNIFEQQENSHSMTLNKFSDVNNLNKNGHKVNYGDFCLWSMSYREILQIFLYLCNCNFNSYWGPNHIETNPLICKANIWTGFYMIGTSVMKELRWSQQN